MAGLTRSMRSVRSATGISLPPSWPTRAVVMPCRNCVAASGDWSSPPSACECMSMKPGATIAPGGVDDALAGPGCQRRPNLDDGVAFDADVGGARGTSGAVDEAAVADQQPASGLLSTTATELPRASTRR